MTRREVAEQLREAAQEIEDGCDIGVLVGDDEACGNYSIEPMQGGEKLRLVVELYFTLDEGSS